MLNEDRLLMEDVDITSLICLVRFMHVFISCSCDESFDDIRVNVDLISELATLQIKTRLIARLTIWN